MKLARAEVVLVDLHLRTPFTTSFGTASQLHRPFVVLHATDGRRGVGEAPTLPTPAYKPEVDAPAVLTSLGEFILPSLARAQARDGAFTDVDRVRASYAWIKGAVFAKSAVEAAWWDLTAQEASAPLWRIWGGERRTFPVGVSIGGKSVADVLTLAERAVERGYQRLKVKIWPGFDLEPVRALRERFPDVVLQVDANSAYDLTTWEGLRALDAFDLLLIEQPLYDDDVYYHAQISRELRTPICLDESIHSLRDVDVAIALWQAGAGTERLIVNIKPPRVSGFAEAIVIAKRCHEAGVRTWIGGMLDSAWGKAFNLNFNGLPEIDLPGDHFSPGGAYFMDDVIAEPLAIHDGQFALGEGAGPGVDLDWERFERLAESQFAVDFAH
ncbi:MAG: o-succinylbenzoate synthase [Thermomicrobiales bacterium]|nr:o-succinylbenzoate synthase [Thermomicrobiales bacterium]